MTRDEMKGICLRILALEFEPQELFDDDFRIATILVCLHKTISDHLSSSKTDQGIVYPLLKLSQHINEIKEAQIDRQKIEEWIELTNEVLAQKMSITREEFQEMLENHGFVGFTK